MIRDVSIGPGARAEDHDHAQAPPGRPAPPFPIFTAAATPRPAPRCPPGAGRVGRFGRAGRPGAARRQAIRHSRRLAGGRLEPLCATVRHCVVAACRAGGRSPESGAAWPLRAGRRLRGAVARYRPAGPARRVRLCAGGVAGSLDPGAGRDRGRCGGRERGLYRAAIIRVSVEPGPRPIRQGVGRRPVDRHPGRAGRRQPQWRRAGRQHPRHPGAEPRGGAGRWLRAGAGRLPGLRGHGPTQLYRPGPDQRRDCQQRSFRDVRRHRRVGGDAHAGRAGHPDGRQPGRPAPEGRVMEQRRGAAASRRRSAAVLHRRALGE